MGLLAVVAVADDHRRGAWEGVHFRFSDEAGARLGKQVAKWDLNHLDELGS